MKFKFSRHIFEKYSNTKFHKNSSSESRDVPCGQTYTRKHIQTDGHDKATSSFSQNCEKRLKTLTRTVSLRFILQNVCYPSIKCRRQFGLLCRPTFIPCWCVHRNNNAV